MKRMRTPFPNAATLGNGALRGTQGRWAMPSTRHQHQHIQEDPQMSRVPYPIRQDYPEAYLPAYDRLLRERGNPPPDIFLALANIPNLLDPLLSFTKEMREGSVIEARLRELSILTVGLVTKAQYEFDHHSNSGLAAGLRREQLEQLADFETSGEFDDRE